MSLQMLLTEGIIDEVLGQLKSGKEAEVWLVRRAEEILAAKIYKEREHRSFKNNAEYKEGRQVRNTRTQRAMAKGSKFGRESNEAEWKAAEADALFKLHASGARVPRPVMFFEGVLLMEVVIDPEGHPAPRLVDAVIAAEKGLPMYEDLRGQAVKLLCADMIHGDLSEFNVLLAWDGPTIIDFPQVISAAQNSRAEHFFKRDVDNLRRFFATIDPAIGLRESDADEIWRAYVRRDLTADFVPTGRVVRKPQPPQQQGRRGGQQAGAQVSYRNQPRGPQGQPNGGSPPARHDSQRGGQTPSLSPQKALPNEQPRNQQPRNEQPRNQQPRNEQPRNEQPRKQQPRNQQPRNQQPRNDPRRNDQPRHDQPRHDQPRHDQPRHDQPRHDQPRNDQPVSQQPRDQQPRSDPPRSTQARSSQPGQPGQPGGQPRSPHPGARNSQRTQPPHPHQATDTAAVAVTGGAPANPGAQPGEAGTSRKRRRRRRR